MLEYTVYVPCKHTVALTTSDFIFKQNNSLDLNFVQTAAL